MKGIQKGKNGIMTRFADDMTIFTEDLEEYMSKFLETINHYSIKN